MSQVIAHWLRQQFVNVADVKRASIEPDSSIIYQTHTADLVVSTWMGARLYVYLLPDVPKVRDIRNTVKENTRSGIGSLFIVNVALLPDHESVIKLTDWQDHLQSLNDSYIYAYGLNDENKLSVKQVHFNPLNRQNEWRVWHFNDFKIDNVTVRKREVQEGLRGKWYVGDITSSAYKRQVNNERANQRFHYRTKYTQDTANGAGANNPIDRRKREDELAPYYALLGVDKDASEKEIKSAFRQMAIKVHPDVSALPRSEAEKRIKQLNEAYEAIKKFHGWG